MPLETARLAREQRVWKAIPSSKTHPRNLGPFLMATLLSRSAFFLLPFPCLGDKSSGNRSSQSPRCLSQDQHELYILCTSPPRTHFLPCPAIPPRFTPSLIPLSCQFKPFPFCCTKFLYFLKNYYYYYFKKRGIFRAAFRQRPISPFPSPPSFSLGRIGPLKFFPRIVG